MAARSKAWVCRRLFAGLVGSNPAETIDVSLVTVVCWQTEVSESGSSLVQRSPTERGAFKDSERSLVLGGHEPQSGRSDRGKKNYTA